MEWGGGGDGGGGGESVASPVKEMSFLVIFCSYFSLRVNLLKVSFLFKGSSWKFTSMGLLEPQIGGGVQCSMSCLGHLHLSATAQPKSAQGNISLIF